jgi:hypothetical protein
MSKVAKKYPYAVIATDVVIFTVDNGDLKVLLMGMQKDNHVCGDNCVWIFFSYFTHRYLV